MPCAAIVFRTLQLANAIGLSFVGSRAQIAALRNKHRGGRIFVIGNGPSLRMEDLTALQGEVTIACNRIYLAFDATPWRPQYYCVSDPHVARFDRNEIASMSAVKLTHEPCWPWLRGMDMLFVPERRTPRIGMERKHWFSTDLRAGAFGGWTVAYLMLQLAYWLGAREVILLGIDHRYVPTAIPGQLNVPMPWPPPRNHFDPRYEKRCDRIGVCVHRQNLAYEQAKRAFERDGRIVRNATRSSDLTVFERVTLEEVLASPTVHENTSSKERNVRC